MSIPKISVQESEHKLKINTVSGFAFMQENLAYGFEPQPVNQGSLTPFGSNNIPLPQITEQATLGGITTHPDIDIIVGTQTNSIVSQLLNSFNYFFPDFPSQEIDSTLVPGNICYFDSSFILGSQTTFDVYNCSLRRATVTELSRGAKCNLFIYIGHENGNLNVLHKGYYDMTNTAMPVWEAGKTIYLNNTNLLDTAPTATSGHWVRSLGFCIPNKENLKRVWFEADSTYLRII